MSELAKLNLGSGIDAIPGYVNVDSVAILGVDAIWDLNQEPWPWADESASEVRAYDVFEHVDDPLLFMRECYRVLEYGGLLNMHTCFWKSQNAFTDPTHKRFCTEETWDYWIPGTYLHSRYGAAYAGKVAFVKEIVALDGTELAIQLRRA